MSFNMMWIEKYRPKKIDDIIGHDEIKSRLKGFISTKSLPHLLFAGPPGTGKTSAVVALAYEIFSKDEIRNNLLELNASDERGIDVIRNTVKDFARTIPSGNAPFKIISLDEADALTPAAQHALRRTMEKYVSTSRFILLCNYPGKIIEPIQSRCAFFRFNQLSNDVILSNLMKIAENEDVIGDITGFETIIQQSNGDMRKAINILQATAATGKKVTKKEVLQTIGGVDNNEILELVELAKKQDFKTALSKLQRLLFMRGVTGSDILRNINSNINKLQLDNESTLNLIKLIAEIDFRLTEGASPDIQLGALLAQLGSLNEK